MKAVRIWTWAAAAFFLASAALAQAPETMRPDVQRLQVQRSHVQWSEAQSGNFVFKGESSAARAQALIQDLESFRREALDILGAEQGPEPLPARVFAITPTQAFESVLPFPGFSVQTRSDLDGPVYLINENADWSAQGVARHTLLQNYSTYLIERHAPDQYPHWMASGLADYMAGFDVIGGAFVPGQDISKYAYPLSRKKWVPMKMVLGAMHDFAPVQSKDDALDTEMFQKAQSWAAVKYILQNRALATKIPVYLDRLDAGQAPSKAFKKAFGMSAKKFEKRLKRQGYTARPASPSAAKMLSSGAALPNVSVLNSFEASLAYADVLRIFAYTDAGYEAADKVYAKGAQSGPQRVLSLAGRADMASARGDFAAGNVYMAKALTLGGQGGQDGQIYKRAGAFYLAQFDETGDSALLVPARDHFAKALEKHPKDPAVNFYYAAICAQIDCPEGTALSAAKQALSVYRDAKHIGVNYNLLPVLEAEGETQMLEAFSGFAQVWGPKT